VATNIRLMRLGKIRAPYYRIVVADSRTKRDGRVIETIGKYHPKEEPSFIEVDSDRAQYWLSVGAQPTEPVAAILRVTGDWQRFKGEPAPAEGVKTAPARPDRRAIFEAAAKESLTDTPAPAKRSAPAQSAPAEQKPAAAEAPAVEEAPQSPAGEAETTPAESSAAQEQAAPADAPAAQEEPAPTEGEAAGAADVSAGDEPVAES
jgi:small subunit ribosomal protein S16